MLFHNIGFCLGNLDLNNICIGRDDKQNIYLTEYKLASEYQHKQNKHTKLS